MLNLFKISPRSQAIQVKPFKTTSRN